MTVTITALTEREFFAWYSLFAEYAASEGVGLTDEHVMRVWTAVQAPGAIAFAARDDAGGIVGLVHAVRFERLLSGRGGYEIEDLFVSEDARRQGVATALVEHVRSRAEAEQQPVLRWTSRPEDPAAQSLQQKFAASQHGWMLQSMPVG